ncbi:MAG TPA: MoaD/ThiS family protein [Actinomycetota bacterium]|nr:MoaD/ThiS family protein [Actinomycetota bacterium]
MPRVRMFGALRELAGGGSAEVPAPTLAELLDRLCELHGDEFKRSLGYAQVLVNGETIEGDGMSVELGDSDEVALLPPVSGG